MKRDDPLIHGKQDATKIQKGRDSTKHVEWKKQTKKHIQQGRNKQEIAENHDQTIADEVLSCFN